MLVKNLLDKIQSCFPIETAMQGDRIGLQIEAFTSDVSGVLFALEVTEEVIDECKRNDFNTIVSFHPLIYAKLSNISQSERVGRLCSLLIKNSINLISLHTTFDAHKQGTSAILANLLGLDVHSFLVPNETDINSGMGVITVPRNKTSISVIDLVQRINLICGSPVRYCSDDAYELHKIAILCGSGTSFIPNVIANSCDCFITADVTYHQFHAANGHFVLIDVGHYEMEQFVSKAVETILQSFLDANEVAHVASKILTNPISYYPDNNYKDIQQQNIK